MNTRYEHAGFWIQSFELEVNNAASSKSELKTQWRVLEKDSSRIQKNHLRSADEAEKWAETERAKRDKT